jgi:hypothetical protein
MYYSTHNTKLNSTSQFHSTNITYQLLLITTDYYNLTTSSPCTVWSTLHSTFLFTLSFTGFKIVVSPLHWYKITQQFQTQAERSAQIYYSPVTQYYKFTATPTCYNIQPHLSQIKVTFTYKSLPVGTQLRHVIPTEQEQQRARAVQCKDLYYLAKCQTPPHSLATSFANFHVLQAWRAVRMA